MAKHEPFIRAQELELESLRKQLISVQSRIGDAQGEVEIIQEKIRHNELGLKLWGSGREIATNEPKERENHKKAKEKVATRSAPGALAVARVDSYGGPPLAAPQPPEEAPSPNHRPEDYGLVSVPPVSSAPSRSAEQGSFIRPITEEEKMRGR